ncbi:hypothetical protein BJF87_20485 [Gordonia sp. CNJ-863]|uniref:T6SS Phospholipase effector Tle1-like catalytic domain-containing protein n=3 Tax=Gordonia alkanivorans TaxID=84096 RepID=F9VWI5_9ACTN|nr:MULTISPECIES: DUF2235 domain-containing protein [Gordonia]ETA05557.1 hypothetical protein V525_19000 [Gordonia alkanivorans CGMCC 6845]MDH3020660.1 DUF2235 domain-containing protein [Gordonia alkanivorans]MDJ0007424.1 DUF2235 domain-containing protein [Gordonia alkanivorans]MDJ0099692.1 DUF2235 domain-containing protein [Gordonia alkanivorans]MDJ0492826.1 DUF2235 domain-containing protein [Gordonia alkanivorans]
MRKRLIICCDGTWKSAKDPRISNVEKIARAVKTDAADGAVQLVHYVNGVGTGSSWSDRVFGGAFGRGLDANLLDAYRFLVLNYEPDDEIFVFGFSRGAYTARSLAGMIGKVGLITPRQLAEDPTSNLFEKALQLYRDKERHAPLGREVPVAFIGVFDTVGALGVPGITRHKHKFHDVNLGKRVEVARQALAIDECRLTFDPCVWEKADNTQTDVKQVWFEGVHSDIGGGLEVVEPSELTLAWMVWEASLRGLEFSYDRFTAIRQPVDPTLPRYAANKSMNAAYQIVNLAKLAIGPFRLHGTTIRHRLQRRRLEIEKDPATPLLIAEPALTRWESDQDGRRRKAPNIGWWVATFQGDPDALRARVVEIPPLTKPLVGV